MNSSMVALPRAADRTVLSVTQYSLITDDPFCTDSCCLTNSGDIYRWSEIGPARSPCFKRFRVVREHLGDDLGSLRVDRVRVCQLPRAG